MNAAALRAGILAVALLLAWRIVQVNVVLYDENGVPRMPAIAVEAPASAALRQALDDNPGHIVALLNLARAHEAAGDEQAARHAYDTAFRLAPLGREVLGAGADYLLRHGATADAIAKLDQLVDAYPDAQAVAFPVLARLLASGAEPAAWRRIAAHRPEWIGQFITFGCGQDLDVAFLVPLLLDRVAQGRAKAAESGCVIDRLRDSDRWAQAYQVWLNTLPRERLGDVGFLYNGSFELATSGTGFDWRPSRARERDVGHSVEMPQAAGVAGQRALRVSYNGKRQSGIPILQYLALAPGRYEMAGLAHPQSISAGRGVQWTLRCVKGGKAQPVIAASERFLGSSEWRRFSFEIAVPADCPGQMVQLEPVGMAEGAVYLAGSAWFDELVLRRR
jgi:tetratricopeptide (TPR) repeat protein